MPKLLSIIIPTYNMEALLPRCLDSLVAAHNAESLEAIVVNDGSKDNSLKVAQQYAANHPMVVTVINKPNGNYGSTINAALPVAQGNYVKVLDSDDFFDTQELDNLLEALATTDADMVVTPFTQIAEGGKREVIRYNTMGREPYEYGKQYGLDDILPDGYIRFFLMHALAYRTQMLRDMHYQQTEGISYTDTEWASLPLFKAQTIIFFDFNVYQYNLDRAGQTMSPAVLMKSLPQIEKVFDNIIHYYGDHYNEVSTIRQAWLKQYIENRIRILYKLYLLDMPREMFTKEEMQRIDDKYSVVMQQYDLHPRLYPENKLLRIEYIRFWQRHHRRWSRPLEWFNNCLDLLAHAVYARLFRK